MVPRRGRRPHAAKATSPNAGITFEVTGFAAITLYDLVNAMDVFFTRGMLCKGGRADARIINGLNLYTGLVPLSAIYILLTCCLKGKEDVGTVDKWRQLLISEFLNCTFMLNFSILA